MAGPAITPEEMQILVSVVGSYKRMRGAFPTEQLRNDLDALYTQAFLRAYETMCRVDRRSHRTTLAGDRKQETVAHPQPKKWILGRYLKQSES